MSCDLRLIHVPFTTSKFFSAVATVAYYVPTYAEKAAYPNAQIYDNDIHIQSIEFRDGMKYFTPNVWAEDKEFIIASAKALAELDSFWNERLSLHEPEVY